MIPYTNNRSGAVILITKELSTNNKSDSKLRVIRKPSTNNIKATNKLKAINRFGIMILNTNNKLSIINLTSNTKRIDLKQDLQITSSSNKQSIDLRNRS